jgi:hypothetical protein
MKQTIGLVVAKIVELSKRVQYGSRFYVDSNLILAQAIFIVYRTVNRSKVATFCTVKVVYIFFSTTSDVRIRRFMSNLATRTFQADEHKRPNAV